MKIALLLNGYFRHYDILWKNFNEYFLDQIRKCGEVDIFFSSWSGLNNTNSFSVKHGADGGTQYGKFDIGDILKKYNPVNYFLGEYKEYEYLFDIRRYYPEVNIGSLHKDIHNNGILFCLNQYFHRHCVNLLKLDHEKKNNFKYDAVISMRPDLFFLKPFDLNRCDLNKLSLRTLYNDAFFVSNSEMNDKIDSLFINISGILDRYKDKKMEWFDNYCPEWWLENHFLDIGLTKDQRIELGEDTFWYFPRKHFLETCYEICNKTNQKEKFEYVINYFEQYG